MASEKTQALFIPEKHYDEKSPKSKGFSKSLLSWVLAALLIALIVALCVQFLYPVVETRYKEDIDTVHVFQGTPIEVHLNHQEKQKEKSNNEINPQWHLDFLINPTRLCDTLNPPESEAYKNDPEVKLLVLVPSAISHFAERRTIRKTWGSVADQPHGPMRLGFVLGVTTNTTEEDLIQYESEVFGDIIQADFLDTYRNLTTKSVLMLKWVSKHCPHAQYFLKADDDTFVNLNVLTNILQKPPFVQEDKFIGGFIHRGAQPSRAPNEKYYVSEGDYADDQYPPYASGSAYVTTGPTAKELFEVSKQVKPFLPMEDVFITGLCADQIDATLIHEPSFRYIEPPKPLNWEHYSSLATAHSISPDEMDTLWNQMTKHLFDTLDMSDSMPSSSEEWLDRPLFDLFDWPSSSKPVSSISNEASIIVKKLNSPEAMNWQMNGINTEVLRDEDSIPSLLQSLVDGLFRSSPDDTISPKNKLKSKDSDPVQWPSLPFFPFGLGNPGNQVNITYFVLEK